MLVDATGPGVSGISGTPDSAGCGGCGAAGGSAAGGGVLSAAGATDTARMHGPPSWAASRLVMCGASESSITVFAAWWGTERTA